MSVRYSVVMIVCVVRSDCVRNGARHVCAVRRWLVLGVCTGRAGMLVASMGMHIPCVLALFGFSVDRK